MFYLLFFILTAIIWVMAGLVKVGLAVKRKVEETILQDELRFPTFRIPTSSIREKRAQLAPAETIGTWRRWS